MSDLLAGALLGFVANVIVNKVWEWLVRSRAHKAARGQVGTWTAHNIHGRDVDLAPMPGALLTTISARSRWKADSHVLDVHGQDDSNERIRDHDGYLAIDPACPRRAIRTVRYVDSDEIAEQRIEISRDNKTLYVFPADPAGTTVDTLCGSDGSVNRSSQKRSFSPHQIFNRLACSSNLAARLYV